MEPTRKIPLTQGYEAIVDTDDYERVMAAGNWYVLVDRRSTYAFRTVRRDDGKRTTEYLHTFLTDWSYVDHRNGNGLDNRRENLRQATHAENQHNARPRRDNASGFKGVSWHKRTMRWRARLKLDGRERSLGYFDTPEDAARAYDAAARESYGDFAWLNFP